MWTSWLPHLIGAVMLATIAATAFGVARWHARPLQPLPAITQGLAGGLLVGLVLCAVFVSSARAFERSWTTYEVAFWENPPFPWQPILLAALCAGALCAARPASPRFHWVIVIIGILGGWLLGAVYTAEIYQQHANLHNPRLQRLAVYTLHPGLPVMVTRGRLNRVRRSIYLPPAMMRDRTAYPAGWLTETAFWKKLPRDYREMNASNPYFSRRGIVTARLEWHTLLTGFYRAQEEPFALWYPGGPIKTALSQVEYRPRP